MEAIVEFRKEIKKGTDIVILKLANGEKAKTYPVRSFKNFILWEHIKVGDHVDGLKWKDKEDGLIDADSPVVRM